MVRAAAIIFLVLCQQHFLLLKDLFFVNAESTLYISPLWSITPAPLVVAVPSDSTANSPTADFINNLCRRDPCRWYRISHRSNDCLTYWGLFRRCMVLVFQCVYVLEMFSSTQGCLASEALFVVRADLDSLNDEYLILSTVQMFGHAPFQLCGPLSKKPALTPVAASLIGRVTAVAASRASFLCSVVWTKTLLSGSCAHCLSIVLVTAEVGLPGVEVMRRALSDNGFEGLLDSALCSAIVWDDFSVTGTLSL